MFLVALIFAFDSQAFRDFLFSYLFNLLSEVSREKIGKKQLIN